MCVQFQCKLYILHWQTSTYIRNPINKWICLTILNIKSFCPVRQVNDRFGVDIFVTYMTKAYYVSPIESNHK